MPAPLFRNIAAAANERRRREARALDDPFYPVVSPSANWDAFYGSLNDQAEAADAAGLNYRVNFSGLGRDADEDYGGGLNYFDRQSLKNQAISQLSNAAAQQARAQDYAQKAAVDAQERARIGDLYRSYGQQVQASQEAPPLEPTDVRMNVDTSRRTGNVVEARPAGTAVDQALARLSPLDRLAYEQNKQKIEAESARN